MICDSNNMSHLCKLRHYEEIPKISEIHLIKDVRKSLKTSRFRIIATALFKIQNPTTWGLSPVMTFEMLAQLYLLILGFFAVEK